MTPDETTPVCVEHRDGWCATRRNHTRYTDVVPTLCGSVVMLPWGIERREPKCPECRRIIAKRRERGETDETTD